MTVSILAATAQSQADDEFSVRWFSGTGKGGQHRNKHQNCCEITHVPTGRKRVGTASRSRESNYRDALEALRGDIRNSRQAHAHERTNAVRKGQIGAGMRGDKRRTYRFQEDSVVDHVTGKRARASAIMRGGFDRLW